LLLKELENELGHFLDNSVGSLFVRYMSTFRNKERLGGASYSTCYGLHLSFSTILIVLALDHQNRAGDPW
jgi:hypothetical protein